MKKRERPRRISGGRASLARTGRAEDEVPFPPPAAQFQPSAQVSSVALDN